MLQPTSQSPVYNNNGAPAWLTNITGGIAFALDAHKQYETNKAIQTTAQAELANAKYVDNSALNSSTTVAKPTTTDGGAGSQSLVPGNITIAGVTMSKNVLYVTAALIGLLVAKKAGVI